MLRIDEVRHQLIEILTKQCVMEGLTSDELSLVCWACGVSVTELMPVENVRPLSGDLFAAYIEKETNHEIQRH